jgi:type VII secretion protein EccB
VIHSGLANPPTDHPPSRYPAEPYRDWEDNRPEMASTPTSKAQVQAYRFVLRRMQSALVRRDAVMLHDPMRNHSRATAVGVVIGVVGMIGFLIYGLFSPDPQVDSETQIVISKQTGQVYVVKQDPRQLIPMTNLASARLLLFSQSNPDKAPSGNGGGDAPAGTGAAPTAAGGEPKLVSEAALAKLPKGRLTGIPDGPDMLPDKEENRIGAEWSVCDTFQVDDNPAAKGRFETTVLAGVSGGGQPLNGNRALLVQAGNDAKKAYLIYEAPKDSSKIGSASAVRAAVDLTDEQVKSALRLGGKKPRAVSTGLLNAIPEVSPLKAPDIADRDKPASYLDGVKIGEVIKVERTGNYEYYVVLKDGVQHVTKAVGDIIRFSYASGRRPQDVEPAKIANASNPSQKLNIADYPADVPDVLDANQDNKVLCLGWKADNWSADNMSEHTRVTIGSSLPTDKDAVPVKINQAGGTGELVSNFVMKPGKGAVVRGSTSTADFTTGPIHVITGRGVKYGVPDKDTAGALGLGPDKFAPAPESILRLLPDGPQLNRTEVARSYDALTIPKENGVMPEQQNKSQGS